jgi:adenylate cyclase
VQATVADLLLNPGDEVYSFRDAADKLGMSLDEVERAWRASGFAPEDPDRKLFRPSDLDVFASFQIGIDLLGLDATIELSRVLGSSVSRIADTAVSLFLTEVEAPLRAKAASERALAEATTESVKSLMSVQRAIDGLFRHHLREAIERFHVASTGDDKRTAQLVVGFVDLVGYTPISEEISSRELSALTSDFEARSQDAITEHHGRLVKLIGDEVMFVAVDASAGIDIALALVEAFDGAAVTPRGGVAFGQVLTRTGDYFGPVVNLASRLADLAIPQEILATTDARDAALARGSAAHFEPAGRRALKGFAEPVQLFSVART